MISVMVEGRIAHEWLLEHGWEMSDTDNQVQRAGGEGFSHNEINEELPFYTTGCSDHIVTPALKRAATLPARFSVAAAHWMAQFLA
jgi:hypothetical protein